MKGFAGVLAGGMARMPRGAALGVGRVLAWAMGSLLRIRRGEVAATLGRCFPEMGKAERAAVYRAMWRNLMEGLVEVCRYAGGRTREVLDEREVRGREHLEKALEDGKGVIALLAHVGNYPLLAADVPRLFGVELSFVYKPFRSAWATKAWQEFQEGAGVEGIPSKGAYRECLRALKAGRVVGFMLDQNRPGGQGVFVPYFGRLASTSPGLALLSWHSGAVVLPVFEHREGGRHVVEIGEAIEPPPDREEATVREYTARYTALIEAEVRRHPAEWLWLHRRWKTRPPEEGG
ncbi:MAG: lysophospholipid acyltransferase family protein [Kiritimatiellae bacterium]|nr:lysophospholipid acyltransferase family protein [Kiritimatiellia bacterium]